MNEQTNLRSVFATTGNCPAVFPFASPGTKGVSPKNKGQKPEKTKGQKPETEGKSPKKLKGKSPKYTNMQIPFSQVRTMRHPTMS